MAEGDLLKKKVDSCSRPGSREGKELCVRQLAELGKKSPTMLFCNACISTCLVRKALTNSVIDINLFGLGGWLAYPCRITALSIMLFQVVTLCFM